MRALVLGASGLLGHTVFRTLAGAAGLTAFGTTRNQNSWVHFPEQLRQNLMIWENHEKDRLSDLFNAIHPDVVINCVGTPQSQWTDYRRLVADFSLLPHLLAGHCRKNNARLILISSDGVFSGVGSKLYSETDVPDPPDDYGSVKLLGEVLQPHVLVIRTSIIGHSLNGSSGLIDWFLSKERSCAGYSNAVFSGLPTVVLASIMRDVLLPRCALHGLYHVASAPISKLALLGLVAQRYGKTINIVPDDSVVVSRSLSSERFAADTGFRAPQWNELIDAMYLDRSTPMVINVY